MLQTVVCVYRYDSTYISIGSRDNALSYEEQACRNLSRLSRTMNIQYILVYSIQFNCFISRPRPISHTYKNYIYICDPLWQNQAFVGTCQLSTEASNPQNRVEVQFFFSFRHAFLWYLSSMLQSFRAPKWIFYMFWRIILKPFRQISCSIYHKQSPN